VHGFWHRKVHLLNPEQFAAELKRALEAITPLVSEPVIGHRAPYFSINGCSLWALDVLRDKGLCYDSSFFPTRNMLYGFPESPRFPHKIENKDLVEFPISTAHWGGVNFPFAGGFYLRTLPYRFICQSIRQLHRQGQPAVMYIHPWELDTGQRFNQVTPRERITHYNGRRSLEGKLRRLFSDFHFQPLRDLLPSLHDFGRPED
jgi:polysaccharide deacetylase family protein (PEP-CTERM system associated)